MTARGKKSDPRQTIGKSGPPVMSDRPDVGADEVPCPKCGEPMTPGGWCDKGHEDVKARPEFPALLRADDGGNLRDGQGGYCGLIDMDNAADVASELVRRWNAHADLVEVCEALLEGSGGDNGCAWCGGYSKCEPTCARIVATTALAKVRT